MNRLTRARIDGDDYSIPTIDGIELAERIRKESNIPFILYTGQGSEEVAERARNRVRERDLDA